VQMDPVKNKAERSHALPRELWPILALIGLACFGFLGRGR